MNSPSTEIALLVEKLGNTKVCQFHLIAFTEFKTTLMILLTYSWISSTVLVIICETFERTAVMVSVSGLVRAASWPWNSYGVWETDCSCGLEACHAPFCLGDPSCCSCCCCASSYSSSSIYVRLFSKSSTIINMNSWASS